MTKVNQGLSKDGCSCQIFDFFIWFVVQEKERNELKKDVSNSIQDIAVHAMSRFLANNFCTVYCSNFESEIHLKLLLKICL